MNGALPFAGEQKSAWLGMNLVLENCVPTNAADPTTAVLIGAPHRRDHPGRPRPDNRRRNGADALPADGLH